MEKVSLRTPDPLPPQDDTFLTSSQGSECDNLMKNFTAVDILVTTGAMSILATYVIRRHLHKSEINFESMYRTADEKELKTENGRALE